MPSADRPVEVTVHGHFGELLQGRLGPGGPVALVTLPSPCLCVTAHLIPGPFGVHSVAGDRLIRRAQAAALHRTVANRPPRGRLLLRANMPPGGGAGSSTAALLATIAAYARAAGRPSPPAAQLAGLCLALEGATDPLMHPDPARLLWASREGRVLAAFPPPPSLEVLGGFDGPGGRTDPADDGFADVADLVAAWPAAAARGDLVALARLATESAARNARARGGPPIESLLALAARHGAVGIVAAHTGSARGLLFAPGAGDQAAALAALRSAGLCGVHRFRLAGAAPLG